MISRKMIFFQNILRCLAQHKKKKTKTKLPQIQQYSPATTNPTKLNNLLHQLPPTTTNQQNLITNSTKKNHQTHHQPPQTHKKTINPQIITTYNHSKTHSQSKPRTTKLHISKPTKPTNHYNCESTARIVTTKLLNSKECGGEINDGCGVQIGDGCV